VIKDHIKSNWPSQKDFKIPASNPPVRERVNLTNAKLQSAAGTVELIVDPACKELIMDFEQVVYKEDSGQIDKDKDRRRTHLSDAAIAALSATSATGFTVSGSWRQQFDWAVVEWNRDNVFEHPALRNLPDGDLSGIQLSYLETRTNCISLDSTWYPTVDWPYLRVWAETNEQDTIYQVPIANYATPVGSYVSATVQFELTGTLTAGDSIDLAWLDQQFNHQITGTDTLASAVASLAAAINAAQGVGVTAAASGAQITLTCTGSAGANGNRIGVYGTVSGQGTEAWSPAFALFSGGVSPSQWQVSLNFGALQDINGNAVPTSSVRKLRWTWAADIQPGEFQRTEFSVVITSWTVTGSNPGYQVAGPGSYRIEDSSTQLQYQGSWTGGIGNYSGGSIQWSTAPGSQISCSYLAQLPHTLYLGTRRADSCGQATVQVDSEAPVVQPGHVEATATIQFSGIPVFSQYTSITIGGTVIQHQNLIGDTAQSIATCLALLVNQGSTEVSAQVSGSQLTLTSRAFGTEGNGITVSANTNGTQFTTQTSGPALAGGVDGPAESPNNILWRTDLQATPRLNRAARD
jgi:hypothetical protein